MLQSISAIFPLRVPIIVKMLFGYKTRHISRAFNDVSYLTNMRKYSEFSEVPSKVNEEIRARKLTKKIKTIMLTNNSRKVT